jgi:DNA-binding transcriptional ArsR family regulator
MEIKDTISALGALAQETRLAIFRLLVETGPPGLAVGAIAERLDIANATLSFHLKELTAAGLTIAIPNGRSIIYSANFATMNALVEYLTENCCAGAGCLPGKSSLAACEVGKCAASTPRKSPPISRRKKS